MRTLDHSPPDILRWLLVRLGLGTDFRLNAAWPVHVAHEPDKPDSVITIYNGSGTDDGSVMQGELQGHYGFQIRIRAANHPTGWAKANTIRATLAEGVPASGQVGTLVVIDTPSSIGTKQYVVQNIAKLGDVIDLGVNVANEKTVLFTLNGVINVDQTA